MAKRLSIQSGYAALLLMAMASGSALAFAQSAHAETHNAVKKNTVLISSDAKIERTEKAADGTTKTLLKNPKDVIVVPGDHVVFTLNYVNQGAEPAAGFRATNPMPGAVQFIAAHEDWAEVSVDGGANWGKLSDLTVKAKSADGTGETTRPASAEDVTHVRWIFPSVIAAGARGSVSYQGIVK